MPNVPTMIFTALPNGLREGGLLGLSVFVSPRLEPPGARLADYELGNFATRVLDMAATGALLVRFNAEPAIPATIDTSTVSPAFWDSLFPPTTLVYGHAVQDHSARAVRSYSIRRVHAYLESLYTQLSEQNLDGFPNLKEPGLLRDLATAVGAMLRIVRGERRDPFLGSLPERPGVEWSPGPHPDAPIENAINQAILQALAQGQLTSFVPAAELYRVLRFYKRGHEEPFRSQLGPVVAEDVPKPLEASPFDFHQVMAALGDHPTLLRKLGLVIDCTVPISRTLTATGDVRVFADWLPGGTASDHSPSTRYAFGGPAGFMTAPRAGSDLEDGLLRLGDANRYDVIQTDIDGNAIKAIDVGSNLNNILVKLLFPAPGESEPYIPVSQPQPESVPAQRNGGFTVARLDRDDNLYQALVLQSGHNSDLDNAVVFADDVMRGYRVDVLDNGMWRSLCRRTVTYVIGDGITVPPITPPPDEGYMKAASASSDPEPTGPNPPDMYLHDSLFGWDNWSLCVARPGRSISYDRDDATRTQTLAIRKEPNTPPPEFPLYTDVHVVPGSLPRLRFGRRYQFRARVVDLAGNSLPYTEADIAAGALTVSAPTPYLRYDPIDTPVVVLRESVTAGESVEHLVIRTQVGTEPIPDAATLFNAVCKRFIAPPKTSQIMAELHGAFDPYWGNPDQAYQIALLESGTLNDPGPTVQLTNNEGELLSFPGDYHRGDPLPPRSYVVHTGSSLDLPYLPDPLALGVALQDFPGFPVIVRPFQFVTAWPYAQPFSLSLVDAAAPSLLPSAEKFTEIGLPPATILKIRYSTYIDDEGLGVMARYRALKDGNSPAAAVIEGKSNQHWMITPWRELTLVHAVEKPMEEPLVDQLSASRGLGETFATLRGAFACHSRSTGQVELLASWTETVDRLHEDGPRDEVREARVFDATVDYDETLRMFPKGKEPIPRHEFGDTKYRSVDYRVLGTTRYREYFPPSFYNQKEFITRLGPSYAGGPVDVSNVARPDIPRVLYIVPTFEWETLSDGATSRRRGRGLRVYVDRPWYSSGNGELLGIVLPRADAVPGPIESFVSRWGADPVFNSNGPSTRMKPEHFASHATDPDKQVIVGQNLILAEADPEDLDLRVDVVGVKPQYSWERKLWFFDIVMNPGTSYFPFVHFALVRFQPISHPLAHLSSVVRSEFAQLVADRTATINVGMSEIEVTVAGPSARNAFGEATQGVSPPFRPAPVNPPGGGPGGGPPGSVETPRAVGANPALIDDDVIVHPPSLTPNPAAGAGHLVRAHLERLDNPAAPDFGWTTLSGGVILPSYTDPLSLQGTVFWKGALNLPADFGADGKSYRVVVREFEVYETDPEVSENLRVPNPQGKPINQRLVYVDTIPLSP